ncbi:hypothetical protein RUND412_006851 [Rhizina undulata]
MRLPETRRTGDHLYIIKAKNVPKVSLQDYLMQPRGFVRLVGSVRPAAGWRSRCCGWRRGKVGVPWKAEVCGAFIPVLDVRRSCPKSCMGQYMWRTPSQGIRLSRVSESSNESPWPPFTIRQSSSSKKPTHGSRQVMELQINAASSSGGGDALTMVNPGKLHPFRNVPVQPLGYLFSKNRAWKNAAAQPNCQW